MCANTHTHTHGCGHQGGGVGDDNTVRHTSIICSSPESRADQRATGAGLRLPSPEMEGASLGGRSLTVPGGALCLPTAEERQER